MNGLSLAYIGDAYYELLIRQYLIEKGYTKVNDLHKNAIRFTSGQQQARILDYLLESNIFDEKEIEIYKKGRNSTSSYRKNITLCEYQKATGFEAIIGYLFEQKNNNRISSLMKIIISYVEGKDHNGTEKKDN